MGANPQYEPPHDGRLSKFSKDELIKYCNVLIGRDYSAKKRAKATAASHKVIKDCHPHQTVYALRDGERQIGLMRVSECTNYYDYEKAVWHNNKPEYTDAKKLDPNGWPIGPTYEL